MSLRAGSGRFVVLLALGLGACGGGPVPNPPAPDLAISYWKLRPDARLRDVVLAVRADEAGHRDVNHQFADDLTARSADSSSPAIPQS